MARWPRSSSILITPTEIFSNPVYLAAVGLTSWMNPFIDIDHRLKHQMINQSSFSEEVHVTL